MFSNKRLIYTHKTEDDLDDCCGGEYFECEESFLRKSIKESIEEMNLDISFDKEINNAYSSLLKFGVYDLPTIRFEFIV